ncbi:uncharacterized protein IAS62_001427 [Cryptococcus decagattii]|uniref:RGS domain-containing protein n=1 Tax=Cryptococcus decagattii TaxID=1859122 RepID=A0ABZ2AS26_9TREE
MDVRIPSPIIIACERLQIRAPIRPKNEQPLRDQAQRAFATFLKKGGSKELSISDELREYVRTCLEASTAPESFLPVLEEIYHTLESQCLPRFLEAVKSNINRPKQLFWYCVGTVDLLIGLTIFLLLTFLLPPSPFSLRTYRLFSTIFVSFGIMQTLLRLLRVLFTNALEDENAEVRDTMGRSDIIGCEPKPQLSASYYPEGGSWIVSDGLGN